MCDRLSSAKNSNSKTKQNGEYKQFIQSIACGLSGRIKHRNRVITTAYFSGLYYTEIITSALLNSFNSLIYHSVRSSSQNFNAFKKHGKKILKNQISLLEII